MFRFCFYFFSLLGIVLVQLPSVLFSQSLVINEIQSSNSSTVQDDYGAYSDWIELYNGSSNPINLQGYSLSDDQDNPQKWIFPSVTIQPGAFLLVFASGLDQYEDGYLHTNFSISKDREEILLSNSSEILIDIYEPVALTTDNSYGRLTDGNINMAFFQGGTPGESNNNQPQYIGYPDLLYFSHQQGFYENSFLLNLICTDSEAKIYYTINGSEPDENSILFTEPILIYNRQAEPNGISTIRTNPESCPGPFGWVEPSDHIFKGSVIKARAFYQNQPVTPVYVKSFFVHPQMYTRYHGLPIISIITDSLNLFDYNTGIYVPGYYHDINPDWTWVFGTGNYHQTGEEWERPANITFFEPNGNVAFQQDVGIRIHGDGSRTLPEKSIRICARSEYGKNTINYKFFPEKDVNSFKRILLRNSGQDFMTTMLTDVVVQGIVKDVGVESMSTRQSIVFINGEFWGIHNIRDRIDKYFFEYNNGANPDHINLLDNYGSVSEGTNIDYLEIIDFVTNNDLSDETNYQWVAQRIDIKNYIDYVIIKQFVAVYDWPGNNVSFWKENLPESKWRWVLYDNDMALVNYDFNSIEHSTNESGTEWPNPAASTLLFRSLLRNETFKQEYLDRFEYHLKTTFKKDRMYEVFNEMKDIIEPVMPEHIARWNYPYTLSYWNYELEIIRIFFENRPCYMLHHLINYFDIEDTSYGYGVCDTINNIDQSIKNNQLLIWPNPTSEYINIDLHDIDNDLTLNSIEIFDLLGRKVMDVPLLTTSPSKNINVKISDLNAGTYILIVRYQNQSFNKSFIKLDY